jgi:hypothetical protein
MAWPTMETKDAAGLILSESRFDLNKESACRLFITFNAIRIGLKIGVGRYGKVVRLILSQDADSRFTP